MRPHATLALAGCLLSALGCHSHRIDAVVTNQTGSPIQLVEVDYPSASFGTQNLAPGAQYRYSFKLLGSGPLKVLYTDSKRRDHTSVGPSLNEGDEGKLMIDLTPADPVWRFAPAPTLSH